MGAGRPAAARGSAWRCGAGLALYMTRGERKACEINSCNVHTVATGRALALRPVQTCCSRRTPKRRPSRSRELGNCSASDVHARHGPSFSRDSCNVVRCLLAASRCVLLRSGCSELARALAQPKAAVWLVGLRTAQSFSLSRENLLGGSSWGGPRACSRCAQRHAFKSVLACDQAA